MFFGIHYVAAKVLLRSIPPMAWATIRVVCAAAVLLVVARALRRPFPRNPGDLWRLALFSIFGVVINQICFVEGLARTTPSHSALVNTTIPAGTLLMAWLLGRERLSAPKIAALTVSLAGVLCVILPGLSGGAGGSLVGDLLTIANALSYALFLVLSKPVLSRTDPLAATALLLAFGAIGIVAVGAPAWGRFDMATLSLEAWALAAFIIVFATAGAYLGNSWAVGRVDASFVALFIYLQPFIAVALSAALHAQLPSARELLGGVLIFAGVYLAVPRASLRLAGASATKSGA